jgi:hypothetical protein
VAGVPSAGAPALFYGQKSGNSTHRRLSQTKAFFEQTPFCLKERSYGTKSQAYGTTDNSAKTGYGTVYTVPR